VFVKLKLNFEIKELVIARGQLVICPFQVIQRLSYWNLGSEQIKGA
jgi:hypothetical protein